jgi:hypothetical protein
LAGVVLAEVGLAWWRFAVFCQGAFQLDSLRRILSGH